MTFIQINLFRSGAPQEGKEDGLVVNVTSPDLTPSKKLPVMVWIHGGGFTSGSGSRQMYGMHHFMDHDVVMVSFNYRLSILGSLYLDRDKVPGNQMMRDQILALQWVQENVVQFGGDPERVTIFGESAGGMSVMNLVLSPAAKGLFSAAITMSGSPFSPFVGADKHAKYYADKVVEKFGGDPSSSVEEKLTLLQSIDAGEFGRETNMFEEFVRAPMPFKPIVDKDLVDDPVLPDEPLTLLKSGNYNKVPLICGANQNEGLLIKGFYERIPEKYTEAFENWGEIGPLAFFHREKDEYSEEESKICLDYREKYFGSTRFGSTGEGNRLLVQMYGDLMFHAPADFLCRTLFEQDPGLPVYGYMYNHQGYFSLYDVLVSKPWKLIIKALAMTLGLDSFRAREGVCHGDELFMMFKGTILPDIAIGDNDKRVRNSMIEKWVNFATNHKPTKDESWTPFNTKTPQYLEIGSEADKMMYPDSYRKRMEDWATIYQKVPPTMRHASSKTWN